MPLEVLFIILSVHGKNDFVETFKNLTRYIDLKIILLDHQNNYIERLNADNKAAKGSSNQFERLTFIIFQTKLFSDLYVAKFLGISTKPFFSYM